MPCRAACPAGTDIPRYVRLTRQGRYYEATAVIREKLPFPKALGLHLQPRVRAATAGGPRSTRPSLSATSNGSPPSMINGQIWRGHGKQLPPSGRSVAVVGAGPAGLTAAYYLGKQGHEVQVFEELAAPGGMLRVGIPAYRLPRETLAEEIAILEEFGVKIVYGHRVEHPATLLKRESDRSGPDGQESGYDAVLMATGAHRGCGCPCPATICPASC